MMTDVRPRRVPGPDHPITIEPASARVEVHHGETLLARSERALELREAEYPPVFYLPIDDVDGAQLRRSDHRTYCPYKGEASYYDVVGHGDELPAVIWSYEDPYPAVAEIRGHVAFYADRVRVAVEPTGGS